MTTTKAAAVAAALLCACAPRHESEPPSAAPARLAPIVVRPASPTTCTATLDGRTFVVPLLDDGLRLAMRRVAASGRRLMIDAGVETPYRCIGGIVFMANRENVPITFVAARPTAR